MLTYRDALPHTPRRVLIAGVTGAGKTTLAKRLASAWGMPHIEIDALFHGPNWTPRLEFLDDVRAFAAEPAWITEWQYSSKGTDSILPQRADTVVWLDYPYRIVRARLIRRTLGRSLLRRRLWNGNVEKPIWRMIGGDPEQSILRWQRATLHNWTERIPALQRQHPHLTLVRLRHPKQARLWLRRR